MTQLTPRDEAAVRAIAQTLGETGREPIRQIRRVLITLGHDTTQALLAETQCIEAQGGMLTKDGARRRTPGGVFFRVVWRRAPPQARAAIFPNKANTAKKWGRKGRGPRGDEVALPPPPPPRDGATTTPAPVARVAVGLDDVPAIIREFGVWGAVSTVKITVIGRPTQTVDRGDVVAVGLVSERAPALPKGLPAPPTPTKYVVLIARKQWTTVADALSDPDDRLIIEGYPSYAPQHAGIMVFATAVTTKQLQAAKRQAPAHP